MEHPRRLSAALITAFALLAPVPLQPQEGRPYFSLSSSRTFSPGEKLAVQLSGYNIKGLQFRLYKVRDPITFFENLDEPHSFNGNSVPPPRTPLEKLRAWKRRTRANLRQLVKAQFSQNPRAHVPSALLQTPPPSPKPSVTAAVNYADIPVLNPSQLLSTWEQNFDTKNSWVSATIDIPEREKGLYVLEGTNGAIHAATILFVSEFAVLTKSAGNRVVVRTVRRDNGAPVTRIPVSIYAQRERVAQGMSDSNGLFEAKLSVTEQITVLAGKGADFAASGSYLNPHLADDLRAYAYTDRPIYRPGHEVNYRVIARSRRPEGYVIPTDKQFDVDVEDSEGTVVHRGRHLLSEFGTLHGKFTLPANAPLGNYMINVRAGEYVDNAAFEVEEYRKPEYDVRVTIDEPRVEQGEPIKAIIDARYFFGEPVAGAKVTWVVHRSRYWSWGREEGEEEDPADGGDSEYENREQVAEERGVLDADGKLAVTVPTARPADGANFDLRYRIEARVTDEAGREISGAGFGLATVGPFRLDISPVKYIYAPGEIAEFVITASDYQNRPAGGVSFDVMLHEYTWRRGMQMGDRVATAAGETGGDGQSKVSLPVRAGSQVAVVRARSPRGRTIEERAYVWVSGGASVWGSDNRQLRIITDKKEYKAGETAEVMVMAPTGTNLWITTEGRQIGQSRFVEVKESSATVQVPITADMSPNIFVNAVAMRDNEQWQGSRILKVPPAASQLSVKLTPVKATFRPGEKASYLLEAKDSAGKPARGEFSVGVVDEGIYAIRPDTTQSPVDFFFGREWNQVNSDSSLSYYFSGEAGPRRMELASIRPRQPRAQLKPDRLVQPKIRKAFPDTALWSPSVVTGPDGRVNVELSFPDSLTTWRATARGVTADTKVGNAMERVIVRKDLLLRLATPRFFRQGDTMTISAIAQNYLTSDKQVKITLEGKGFEILDGAEKSVTVPSRTTGSVEFRVKVLNVAEATVLGKALTNEESDALELTLPVVPVGVKMSDSRGGVLINETAVDFDFAFPPDSDPATRRLRVSVAPSPAGALFDALDYLVTFPYGCTEQTMSSFLPNVIVTEAVKNLGLKGRVDEKELRRKARAGMDRLYDFQHGDGGWGWWQNDDSDAFMTAYVVAGLSQARDAGYEVEDGRVENGAKWLAQSANIARRSPELRAYASYAMHLGGEPSTDLRNSLYAARGELSPYALALTGLTFDKGSAEAAQLAALLDGKVKQTATEASWEMGRDPFLDVDIDTGNEATAFALKFLTRERPADPLLPKAALYLVNHRTGGGYYWNTTKQTALVIHGLVDYLKQSGELNPDSELKVSVNGTVVASQRYSPAEQFNPAVAEIPAGSGPVKIRVERSGKGRAYWAVQGGYFSTSPNARSTDAQLSVEREYFLLKAVDQGGRIVHDLEPISGPLKTGDVVAVRLRVQAPGGRYSLLEDPIPAGAEIIPRDDLYNIRNKPFWYTYYFDRREFRDDRAAFFRSWFPREQANYFYLLKVTNAGAFGISPAKLSLMYQPDSYALTGPARWEVQ